jgi:hypothetical protein
VYNAEGRKLTEFCEVNMFEILNGKYFEDTIGEFTFVGQIGKSMVDYALMSEGLLLALVDFRIGEEVISCHVPLTIILRMGREMDLGGCTVVMNQTKKIVRFRWTKCINEDFMYTLCDDSSVLCRLRDWLINNRILSKFQAGFVINKRTTDNIFVIKQVHNRQIFKSKKRACLLVCGGPRKSI